MYQVFYKNWQGKWTADRDYPTKDKAERRLSKVKKRYALNGQATVQIVG